SFFLFQPGRFSLGTTGGAQVVPLNRNQMALATGLLFASGLTAGSGVRADEQLFREKVAPIFERHCVVCHQGDKPKGGLSLVAGKGLAIGGESGRVVEPGKPDESLLVEMISGEKPAMPQKSKPLSKDEAAAIRQCIARRGGRARRPAAARQAAGRRRR